MFPTPGYSGSIKVSPLHGLSSSPFLCLDALSPNLHTVNSFYDPDLSSDHIFKDISPTTLPKEPLHIPVPHIY